MQSIAKDTGGKVSLIGWSLGGIYAREFAGPPQSVRSVITLGTPFQETRSHQRLAALRVRQRTQARRQELLAQIKQPPPCLPRPSSAARTAWCPGHFRFSRIANTENIEVVASHIGMGMNPITLYAVADRPAQPEGPVEQVPSRRLAAVVFRTIRGMRIRFGDFLALSVRR